MMARNDFDCIVVGSGHAGVEAAHAAAAIGAKTALLTISKDAIARMSCNPAIGGLAKGQIAREVDALGGLMGLATDAAGIQFRVLNQSKGPAVQSPRAQVDRHLYSQWIAEKLQHVPNLTIVETIAAEIIVENGKVVGICSTDGKKFTAPTVVLTTGTFLRGLMHIGNEQTPGGRIDEPPSNELSESLISLGIELKRLKTGTPPRLDPSTIDFTKLQPQYGDEQPQPFSFMHNHIDRSQVPCWITWTNESIHKLLRDNLDKAPLYTGQIQSTGPRYCPSIESKIVRFSDKDRHQVYLEPEEQDVKTIYCNGISTSLPRNIQHELISLLPGAENARILRYAYAIEYDYAPPRQLYSSLETRKISGLFLAGQINGTSGYEEAAAQGIMAGINAAMKLQNKEPLVLSRDQAYIGVLIDDLMTKDITEPYRMFTSRAEFRLSLRSDNADRRLTEIGIAAGLVDKDRERIYQQKVSNIARLKEYLENTRTYGTSLWQQLARPNSNIEKILADYPGFLKDELTQQQLQAVAIDAKYEGYLEKQRRLARDTQHLRKQKIPNNIDYSDIAHLRNEAREKLAEFRPENLGQAQRLSGVNPADITVLQVYLKKTYSRRNNSNMPKVHES